MRSWGSATGCWSCGAGRSWPRCRATGSTTSGCSGMRSSEEMRSAMGTRAVTKASPSRIFLGEFRWERVGLLAAFLAMLGTYAVLSPNFLTLRNVTNVLMQSSALLFLRSEEHTSELQSRLHLVCRLLLEKKN